MSTTTRLILPVLVAAAACAGSREDPAPIRSGTGEFITILDASALLPSDAAGRPVGAPAELAVDDEVVWRGRIDPAEFVPEVLPIAVAPLAPGRHDFRLTVGGRDHRASFTLPEDHPRPEYMPESLHLLAGAGTLRAALMTPVYE